MELETGEGCLDPGSLPIMSSERFMPTPSLGSANAVVQSAVVCSVGKAMAAKGALALFALWCILELKSFVLYV